ncbi:Subtilisin-like protease [Lachnellula hyalina]|uniref:Subtilisin-like protease n=1 Tax=Lachnellula hyalina TaxID=1316788 RepID=A0A8H8TXG3_9HELO|nr:Subtilisin-like protease [Lachnellula hyalina]TVY23887.1 Subtilisin-like protease [Lachnellula hyalina]
MVSYLVKLAGLAAVIAPVFATPVPNAGHLKIRNNDASDVIPNSYIVVYKSDIDDDTIESHQNSIGSMLSRRDTQGVGATYTMELLKGYQINADSGTMDKIGAKPEVDYIQKDRKVYANDLTTQTQAPWGLGRISHRDKGSHSYTYDTTAGSGANVYVVDTGIYTGHSEFGGRASMGANFVTGSDNTDENGHGTHCAATIAGTNYGVAKSANVVGVKVLGKDGVGSTSDVISGVQWVGANHAANAVLTMSLGESFDSAVNSAVKSIYNLGVTVVVAAGNSATDVSGFSPASEPTAITVGAIDSGDARASFSNFGSLVDIFSPGVNILSAWIGGTDATRMMSGTSMAAPHVAGLAAYLIVLESISTPAAVASRLQALATSGKITQAESTNNLIGYNGDDA